MPRFRPPWPARVRQSPPETPVSRRPALAPFLLAACALLLSGGDAAAQGHIELLINRGESTTTLAGTTVVSETLEEVKFTRKGSTRLETRKTADVVAVVHGPGSPTLEAARAARAAGDLSNALTLYATASREAEPAWMAPVALLELAAAHAERGPDGAGLGEARVTLERFVAEHADHRLLPEALLGLVDARTALGDKPGAEDAARRILELAGSGKITADWGPRAHLATGRALLAAKDGAGAKAAFSSAESLAATSRANLGERADLAPVLDQLLLAARSGVGSAMLTTGDLPGARSYFARLMQEGQTSPSVLAAAQNGLAEADFLEGKLKEAQLGFARVAVTGAGEADEHAKALYYLGRCAEALGQAGRERNGRTAARDYFQEVQTRHPGSHWARLAREFLF